MTKIFEDYFSELQADMVSICLEYVEGNADNIYIYCSYEANTYSFDFFYNVDGHMLQKHELNKLNDSYDTSLNRQEVLLDIGLQNLKKIHEYCILYKQDMPTEMKLYYDVKNNSLKAKYSYELMYSKDNQLLPDHIFNSWIKELQKESNTVI